MNRRTNALARAVCLLLALVLALGVAPVQAQTVESRTVTAIPYAAEDLHSGEVYESDYVNLSDLYDPDEIVDVIVELDDRPLLETYAKSGAASLRSYQLGDGAEEKTALLAAQKRVIHQIENLTAVELQYQYTTVLNGFAIRVRYGDLETIQTLPGVKNAFVAAVNYLVEPAVDSAAEMGNALAAWNSGYTGAGVTIAVIDTGLDTDHEAFVTAPKDPAVDREAMADALSGQTLTAETAYGPLTVEDVYISDKIPYAFDYADNDTDVNPDTAPDANNVSHGTHVAGIAAGFAQAADGAVTFSGVAPDAQLLIMKAFTDQGGGTADTVTLAALEDAVNLGADIINMSLGTDSGFTASRDQAISAAYQRVRDAGISLVCAAGNQYDSALMNNSGIHMNLSSDIDTGVVSSPASYGAALAVASAENLVAQLPAISAGGRMITYTGTSRPITAIAGTYAYVPIGGTGTASDYAAAGDLTGKIALVRRGELTFTEKVLNGASAGAAAVIVYDNAAGTLSNMTVEGASIPAIFITLADGEYLLGLEEKTLTVHAGDQTMTNPLGSEMSEFTSLGVTSELTLKPEITAPGGYIYSTLPESLGGYGSMSGTSMASPYIAGAAALVRQYLRPQNPAASEKELQERTNQLLMSTAQPLTDPATDLPYTPRLQGNGLVNVGAALDAAAWISTEADGGRPVLNLGDDVSRTGSYTLSFLVTNTGEKDLRYTLDVTALSPAVTTDGIDTYLTTSSVMLEASVENAQTVTVPAGETVTVAYTLTLSDEDKSYLDANFENGAYVEGFVRLMSLDGGADLTAAFLAFYGDWSQAPVMDHGDWYRNPEDAMSFMHQAAGYIPYFYGYALLGQNAFVAEQTYIPENFAISPNGDGYFDDVELQVGLLRNAETVTYTVTNENGDVYYEFVSHQNRKTVYSAAYGMMVPMSAYAGYAPTPYGGTDASGRVLPDGTRLTYTVTAELAYSGHERNNQNSTWSFPLLIDSTAPELRDMSVRITTKEGRTYLEGTFRDEYAMMDAAAMGVLIYGNSIYGDVNTRQDLGSDGSQELSFRFDITDLDSEYVYLMGYDSAYNSVSYLIPLTGEEGLTITSSSILLNVGEAAQIAVIDTSGASHITWTSDNEAVAAVNENGVITALSSGTAMVTATNGIESVSCMVGVRPETTVESFRLNVDYMEVPLNSAAQLEIVDILPEGVFRRAEDAVWTTSDPEVIGLYGQYFYADKAGTATITATMDGVSASCTVRVVPMDGERELFLCNELGGEYPFMQSNYITDYQIVLAAKYRNAAGKVSDVGEKLVWTTSDPEILEISVGSNAGGTIQADGSILADRVLLEHVGPGIATVTATTQDGSASRTYTVNVYPNQPLYLYIDPSDVTMDMGETREITYSFDQHGSRPEDDRVFWKSLNEDVVTVENGVLTAVRPGCAMVVGTLTSGYDSFMTVYVNETEHNWQATVTEPTCTERGYTTYTCSYCGESYVDEDSYTEPLGHTWAGLECTVCGAVRENPFTDVTETDFFFDPVLWAVENGITNGTTPTTFGPGNNCQRAHVVTFLWRAAGSPEPQTTVNPFVDVKESDFYYKAVLWAVENGITNGLDESHFGPYAACNRAQVVTFLWRALDKPAPASTTHPFTDVTAGQFYYDAMLWAVETAVTNGLTHTTFGPNAICNRAQIVTFLYRAFA